MVERERDHALLRVHSYGDIAVRELREFLDDFEYAYNGICGFATVVAQVEAAYFVRSRRLRGSFLPFSPSWWAPLTYSREQAASLVLSRDLLVVRAARLESPGFWDFVGKTLSLEALNNWLTGRQERRERRARAPHVRRMEDLEYEDRVTQVVLHQYQAAREMGMTDEDLAPVRNQLIAKPLRQLDRHQDSGLIQGTELLAIGSRASEGRVEAEEEGFFEAPTQEPLGPDDEENF
jgi:hypothetical protein